MSEMSNKVNGYRARVADIVKSAHVPLGTEKQREVRAKAVLDAITYWAEKLRLGYMIEGNGPADVEVVAHNARSAALEEARNLQRQMREQEQKKIVAPTPREVNAIAPK